jgi:glucose-6-phosphate 1-epimerase
MSTDHQSTAVHHLRVEQPLGAGIAQAQVYSFGAHVTSWSDAASAGATPTDYLFLSETAVLDGTKPIRGGVPICWPQFGSFGPLAQHGFARNTVWSLVRSNSQSDDGMCTSSLVFALPALESSPAPEWPHQCRVEYTVALTWRRGEPSSRLRCGLSVLYLEPAAGPLSFTVALHSYFRVSDISNASVSPLAGLGYLDQLKKDDSGKPRRFEWENAAVHFAAETDMIFERAFQPERDSTLHIRDAGANRVFRIATHNLPDAVVWNAWAAKAASMKDMEPDGYGCVRFLHLSLIMLIALFPADF